MSNPYSKLPPRSFWRQAVGNCEPQEINGLWVPKFSIGPNDPVATLGSCFAQHISKALMRSGYSWLNSEPAPYLFPEDCKSKFYYDVFSARIGNVYTAALLKQWVHWAFELSSPPEETWCADGRYFDPFRPTIEPDGFASETELRATRQHTLRSLRRMFSECRFFVFTLGLTEAWVNTQHQFVYPMCPGTSAGDYDDRYHGFRNYTYPEIISDLNDVLDILKQHNPSIEFILTVSPVPLTATASPDHVLVATTYSKSTLRAVAGDLCSKRSDTDYFPSYEIITSFPYRGMFFDNNLRTVTSQGVEFVMGAFLGSIGASGRADAQTRTTLLQDLHPSSHQLSGFVDEVCEDLLLDAFGSASQ